MNTSSMLRQDWFGLLAVAAAATLLLSIMRPDFLSAFNMFVIFSTMALSLLIAFGQMIIIAIGQMNLALGAIGGLAAIAFSGMMEVWGLPAPVAAVLALAIGGACGFVNGVVTTRSGLSAFIVTLATLYIFKGVNLGITEAIPFYDVPPEVKGFGAATLLGIIPWVLVPTAIVTVAVWFMFRRLPIGRQILAVGANTHAAELSGISVPRAVVTAHVLSGLLAALAGILAVARLGVGQPTIGDDWLIASFAAPVIGGAVLSGGHVSVVGTVLGVVIVALITQGLVLFAVDPYYVQFILGFLILGAVGFNRLRETRIGAAA